MHGVPIYQYIKRTCKSVDFKCTYIQRQEPSRSRQSAGMPQYALMQPLAREQAKKEQPAALTENTRLNLRQQRDPVEYASLKAQLL